MFKYTQLTSLWIVAKIEWAKNWQRLVGPLNYLVSFAYEPYKTRFFLQNSQTKLGLLQKEP